MIPQLPISSYEENLKQFKSICQATFYPTFLINKIIDSLEECSKNEIEMECDLNKDNLAIAFLLEYPDFFSNLDCFEIRKFVKIYNKLHHHDSSTYVTKERKDYIAKNLKLATYLAVKKSKSFELLEPDSALVESDFDPKKLSDLKHQLGIDETLDSDGLMRLFFTLKYFGEENNFISAIRSDKIHPDILLNYYLVLEDNELSHVHMIRKLQNKTKKELSEVFFKKLEEGTKHFCTSFYSPAIGSIFGDKYVGFTIDQDVTPVIHSVDDFYSENFSFPRFRDFNGSDQPIFREFVESRNCFTFSMLYCRGFFCKTDPGKPLLFRIPSNLNPRLTYREVMEEYLFHQHLVINPSAQFIDNYSDTDTISSPQLYHDGSNGYLNVGSSSILNRIYNEVTINESNIYLNLSDINGIVFCYDIENLIDFYTETRLKKQDTLDDSEKFEHEISKIKWQREKFCKDIEKSLTEKLKELKEDLDNLKETSDGKCNPSQSRILSKYSKAYLDCDPLSLICFGQDREFYGKHDQVISIRDRLKMINPENISIYLRSLINKTTSDLEYLEELAKMPERSEIEKKLTRDLHIYDKNSHQEITLTEILIGSSTEIDLKNLFLGDETQSRKTEKFKIFVQKLGKEDFFSNDRYPLDTDRKLQNKCNIIDKLNYIGNELGVDLEEEIAIGKEMQYYRPAPIKKDIKPDIKSPKIPSQLSMDDHDKKSLTLDTKADFKDTEYQLSQAEIKDLLLSYRLQYGDKNLETRYYDTVYKASPNQQSRFNISFFSLKQKRLYPETFNLENSINNAFQNLGGQITQYEHFCQREKSSQDKGRDIHDGHHAMTTSYYAKELLRRYQEKKHLFSVEMQTQIAEFDDPQKVKDLEVLSIMHDVARTHGDYDQDEYKNAFYVALKLRKMGDPRFQGDMITQEGLKMITDLANKESKDAGKSLMSKLIQSADSLAILRCDEFKKGQIKYSFEMNECYQDFAKIENQEEKNRELARLKVIGYLLQENEKKFAPPKFLEFSTNPFEEFSKDKKIQDASKIFKFEITHDQKGFTALLKAGCFEYIKSNFNEKQIEDFYRGSQSIVEKASTLLTCQPQNFDSYVASQTDSSSEQSTRIPSSVATVVIPSQSSIQAPTQTNRMT